MSDDALLTQLRDRAAGHLPGHLGIEITAASADAIEGRLPVREAVMAPNGFLHAASVVGLADTLCGFGTIANLPDGATGFTTIELKSNFLGTARQGALAARATPVHLGRTTQVWDARAWREGEEERTIALFRCTQMVLWPRPA